MDNINNTYQKLLDFMFLVNETESFDEFCSFLYNFSRNRLNSPAAIIFFELNKKKILFQDYWKNGKNYTKNDYKLFDIITNKKDKMAIEDDREHLIIKIGYFKKNSFSLVLEEKFFPSNIIEQYFTPLLENTLLKLERYEEASKNRLLINIDEVTGLFNQRKLIQDIRKYIDEYVDSLLGFSLIFVDVDSFKKINDTHGHLVGSRLLMDVGKIIKGTVRANDCCYRYGGDEFVVITPELNYENSYALSSRILSNIRSKIFKVRKGEGIGKKSEIDLSVSIGISNFPKDATSFQEIINIADKMMYEAKKNGRGQICSSSEFITN